MICIVYLMNILFSENTLKLLMIARFIIVVNREKNLRKAIKG